MKSKNGPLHHTQLPIDVLQVKNERNMVLSS